jgi:O-antigen/teichoic acid export membrane protein
VHPGATPPTPDPARDATRPKNRLSPAAVLSGSPEIRHAMLVAFAAALVGVFSLATTVFVAHVLTTRGYGTLVILLALFLVVSLPGSALLVGVVRRVSAWDAVGVPERVQPWAARVHRIGEISIIGLAVVAWLIRVPVAHALSLPSPSGVAEVLTAGGVWILVSIDRGLLQVRRSYLNLSTNLVIEAVTRCALTIGMAAELGVEGAALGLLFAEVVTATHARVMSTRSLAHPIARVDLPPQPSEVAGAPTGDTTGDTVGDEARAATAEAAGTKVWAAVHGGRDLLADVLSALGALALFAVVQNLDVIILGAKAPGHSGAYAAISVPSKALVFGALTLSNYLLPEASIRHQRGAHALRPLGHTLMVLALPCAVLLLAVLVAPHQLLRVVFGPRFTAAASAFSALVLAMIFLSVTLVLAVYLLGVGWRWVVLVLFVGGAVLAAAVALAGGRYTDTTRADLAVQAGLCAAMAVCFVTVHRRAVRGAPASA